MNLSRAPLSTATAPYIHGIGALFRRRLVHRAVAETLPEVPAGNLLELLVAELDALGFGKLNQLVGTRASACLLHLFGGQILGFHRCPFAVVCGPHPLYAGAGRRVPRERPETAGTGSRS